MRESSENLEVIRQRETFLNDENVEVTINCQHKGTKGITLIALIVTIIVLLILAMTSISLVLRNNLIEKTKIAKNEYEQSAKNESDELDHIEDVVNRALNGSTASPSTGEDNGAKHLEYLKKKVGLIETDEDDLNKIKQEFFQLYEQNLTYLIEKDLGYMYIDGYIYYTVPDIIDIFLLEKNSDEYNEIKALIEESIIIEEELNELLIGTGYTYNVNDEYENEATAKYLESNLIGK